MRIIHLPADRPDLVDQTAGLLLDAFRGRTEDWQELDAARQEVIESQRESKISSVALDDFGQVIGWIGAIPMYRGNVWEIHPLVVEIGHQRRGIGRALVQDLESLVRQRGGVTLWAGSDDENHETSLSNVDLYADLPGALRAAHNLGAHPYEFFVRIGFTIVGVIPDANGPGKPDILLAKRVR